MLVVAALAAVLSAGTATDTPARVATGPAMTDKVELSLFNRTRRVPSFTRQTKLACNVCHNGFPQLSPFGRLFKLNGYTMTGIQPITAQKDTASPLQLSLSPIAPLSVMAIVAATQVSTVVPGTLNTTTQF